MEFYLAVLLVSSLTGVGLLALWAATSDRHWFLRCSVFAGAIASLLLIPAYEVFVAFALQGLVIAVGTRIYRWAAKGHRIEDGRFRLATLLQLIVLLSAACAVSMQLPKLNSSAWISVVLIGVNSGLTTLVAAWVAFGARFRLWQRLLLGSFATLIIAMPLVGGDWFALSMISQGLVSWPPEPTPIALAGMFGGPDENDPMTVWFAIGFLSVALTVIICWLLRGPVAPMTWRRPERKIARGILTLLFIGLVAPAAYVYFQLMTPLSIPAQSLPTDNGYAQLLEAGKIAGGWVFNTTLTDPDDADDKTLIAAVDEMEKAYALVTKGLVKPVRMPINYTPSHDWGIGSIQEMRSLARSMRGRALLSVRQGEFDRATDELLQIIQFGHAIIPETLMVQALVGVAIAGIGQHDLYDIRTQLDDEQAARVIRLLSQWDSKREPTQSFIDRDRIWSQHAFGWHGHLVQLIGDWANPDTWSTENSFRTAMNRDSAISRLLCTELALEIYRGAYGRFPQSLEELVPKYLDAVPLDSYSLEAQPLRYKLVKDDDGQESFVLYSVGSDREDDGGVLPTDYAGDVQLWYIDSGDLRLAYLYAPEPESDLAVEDLAEEATDEVDSALVDE